jgi:hypothetical protein
MVLGMWQDRPLLSEADGPRDMRHDLRAVRDVSINANGQRHPGRTFPCPRGQGANSRSFLRPWRSFDGRFRVEPSF